MAGIAADGTRIGPPGKARGKRRAAGIYGAIITAAILAAAGAELPTRALSVSVVVTLLVYWVAEEYAELLGEQVEGGRLPTWPYIRGALAATWPMVSASYLPLLALVLARLAGAPASSRRQRRADRGDRAADSPRMGRGARLSGLHGRQLLATTSIAAALGTDNDRAEGPVLVHLPLNNRSGIVSVNRVIAVCIPITVVPMSLAMVLIATFMLLRHSWR